MDVTAKKLELEQLRTKAYSLKTKKAQDKAWFKVRELDREIWSHLIDERNNYYAQHSIKGTVTRFYDGCEDVLVDTCYGPLWIPITADILTKSWYPGTCCVEYVAGQSIVIEIDVEVDSDRLCLYVVPKRVYGGTINASKYETLCGQNNLAFFKYKNGHMSGLFASK